MRQRGFVTLAFLFLAAGSSGSYLYILNMHMVHTFNH